jgi:hypothetical protein
MRESGSIRSTYGRRRRPSRPLDRLIRPWSGALGSCTYMRRGLNPAKQALRRVSAGYRRRRGKSVWAWSDAEVTGEAAVEAGAALIETFNRYRGAVVAVFRFDGVEGGNC